MSTKTKQIEAELWMDSLAETEAKLVELEVERPDPGSKIAIHTFIDGKGSMVSYYLHPEQAIALARDLLNAEAEADA